jgi:hypothetical protein
MEDYSKYSRPALITMFKALTQKQQYLETLSRRVFDTERVRIFQELSLVHNSKKYLNRALESANIQFIISQNAKATDHKYLQDQIQVADQTRRIKLLQEDDLDWAKIHDARMLGLQADIKKIHQKPSPKPATQKPDPNPQPQKPTFSVLDDPDWDINPSNGDQRRRDMFSEGMLIMKGRLDRIREDDGDLGAEIEEFSKRDNREKAINVVDLYLREEAVRVGVREKVYGGGEVGG